MAESIKARMDKLRAEMLALGEEQKTKLRQTLQQANRLAVEIVNAESTFGPGWAHECRLLVEANERLMERLSAIDARQDTPG